MDSNRIKNLATGVRDALRAEVGWLYQFYVAERKDEVSAGYERHKKAQDKAA